MSAVGSFNTQDVHGLNNPHAQTSKTVYFPKTCVAPPRLPLGLTSVHMRPGSNLRIRAYADNVDTQKFTAHVDTWADTTLYSAEFNYLIEKPANLDFQSGEFDTHQVHTCARPQRETLRRVDFARPFVTPPKLVVFLKAWDIRGGTYARLMTYASNIDAKGFTIHIDTWDDTILFWAVAGWIAYPEDKDYILCGTANTGEVHATHNPHVHTRSDVTFRNTEFLRRPSIFFALNQINMATDANLKIRAYVDNVSTEGMTWHIDSCAGTRHWSAGISYIAFN